MTVLRFLIFYIAICLANTAYAAPLRVALLLEHGDDSAWTGLLRKGLEQAAKKFDIDAEVLIFPPDESQRDNFRKAAETHDLVLVASDNLHEALRDNAANYRRVKFGSIDAGIRAPNIMSVTFADEQAAFLAGAASAMLASEKPVLGWLSGKDTPAMRSLFSGYYEGAHLADEDSKVIQAVAGSFNDPGAAASKAQWLIDNGARVIVLAAGAGNASARAVAQKARIPVIELDAASDSAGIAKAADRAVQEIVASAVGAFRGKEIVTYDLANGGVAFNGLEKLSGKSGAVHQSISRRVGELKREIEKGNIRLQSMRQRTLCDCLD